MKKIVLTILLSIIFCTGCMKKEEGEDVKFEKYAYAYQTIIDNDQFLDESDKYDLYITMSKTDEGYTYFINIDNARIAMYNINIMVVEDNTDYDLATKMMPSLGILDSVEYNMIPNQSDYKKNYYKGLVVSGLVDNKIVNLKIKVSYKDYLLVKETSDFYNITVDYDSFIMSDKEEKNKNE